MIKTSAKKNVQLLVELSYQMGLRHVIISPGSRNAPLTIAFNQHPGIHCTAIPDERVAAFFAMGMAQQTNDLVAVLCTSGSAPLNYYPAIAEAYYQRIPLLVFTADRPTSWVNQGDGQTIVQHEVFKNHINASITIDDVQDTADYHWYMKRELSAVVDKAKGSELGPVHINVALSEPLYKQAEMSVLSKVEPIHFPRLKTVLSESQLTEVLETWNKSEKIMFICGQMPKNDSLNTFLSQMAYRPNVAVLVEHTSNLFDENFIACIDRTLNSISPEHEEDFAPDLLIYLGGAIVSKKIKAFLRKNKANVHWKVGQDFPEMDTFQQLTHSFRMDADRFLKQLSERITDNTKHVAFAARWKKLDYLAQEKAEQYLEKVAFCDLKVMQRILDYLPENSHLHLGNSSVIRYALLFNPIENQQYWCNRGTSGIDGSTSTALGSAYMNKESWHTFVTGDMSFFYDSNALWNHVTTPNLRIVLIHNGGGSIFKIIPGPDTTSELEDYFVFDNNFSAADICKTFGVEYFKVKNLGDLETVLPEFYQFEEGGHAKLLEIVTKDQDNEKRLKDYFTSIKV